MNHFMAMLAVAIVAASGGFGQQKPDPVATLQGTKERLLADLKRMPRYTCVQTITRTYYDLRRAAHGSSCSDLIRARRSKRNASSAFGWDRLRLEVAWVDGNNMYSWVGAPSFANDNLDKLAGEGPLASGDFGSLVREILLHATVAFEREQFIDGKHVLEYSYDMPVEKSTYNIKTSEGEQPIQYDGTLLLNPETQDLVNVTMRMGNLPRSISTCAADTETSYERTLIHDRLVLIPRQTQLDIVSVSGTESMGDTKFTNCREYASTIRFLPDGSKTSITQQPAISAHDESPTLPAGLPFEARITTTVDSDIAAAGDPIEAVLLSPIRSSNHKAVLAPAGTRIHGRLSNFRWRSKPVTKYELTLRFESVEINGRK
ncbi:MAG TPA: hypothetical protein VHN74_21165, partial [Candidatus Angelobacter sp.]|nr:hypothetical protein [Candidatus Angelobacter sp.]